MASLGRCLILVAAVLVTRASALGQQAIVGFTSSANSLQIAGGPISAGQIRVSPNEYWGVIRAANDLAVDFGRVTGTNCTLSNGETGASPATYGYDPINNKNNTEVRPTGVLGGCYFLKGRRLLSVVLGLEKHPKPIRPIVRPASSIGRA